MMRLIRAIWVLPATALLLAVTVAPAQEKADSKEGPLEGNAVTTSTGGRETKELKLPAAIDNLCVAGSGKYILAHLKSVQKLAVIDVESAKVVKYIPIAAPEILFAGGAEKFFVILKDQSIIQRWDLKTLERELATPLSTAAPATMAMGHSSLGPVFVGGGNDSFNSSFSLLDPQTMKPKQENKERSQGREFECGPGCVVRASANGHTFTSWRTGVSPAGFFILRVGGNNPETSYEHNSLGLLTPSPDGSRIYTSGGIFTNQAKPVTTPDADRWKHLWLPSVTGDYVLQLANSDFRQEGEPRDITICLAGDNQPLVTLPKVLPAMERFPSTPSKLTLDKRLLFFPDVSTMAIVATTDDKIDLMKVDIDSELEKADVDYLFFTSRPPLSGKTGAKFEYSPAVKSKRGGVKITVASGPEGMTADSAGKVTWPIPADGAGRHDIILAASDKSGQEVFQTITLDVSVDPTTVVKATAPKPADRPDKDGATTSAANSSSSTTKIKLGPITPTVMEGDKAVIKLPAPATQIAVGGGGRLIVLYLQSLGKLAVVDVTTAKIAGYIPADDGNVQYAAGADKLVLLLGEKNVISRWNLATLQRELAVSVDGPVRQVLMGSNSSGPVLLLRGSEHGHTSNVQFLTLDKFTPINQGLSQKDQLFVEHTQFARVSADGRTFSLPGSFSPLVVTYDGSTLELKRNQDHRSQLPGLPIPSPDGSVMYVGRGRYTRELKEISRGEFGSAMLIPATHGKYYLSVQLRGEHHPSAKQKLGVHIEGDARPLVTLDDFELIGANSDGFHSYSQIDIDDRLIFVPDAKVIAVVSPTMDQVELRRFDLDEALEAAEIDYLVVTSNPPTQAKPGEDVRYQLAVKAKKGGVKYRLEAGPEGMVLSPAGLLTWKAEPGQHSVILVVSDAVGQEVFHTFQLSVVDLAPKPSPQPSSVATTADRGTDRVRTVPSEDAVVPVERPGSSLPKSSPAGQNGKPSDDFASPVPPTPFAVLIGQTRVWTDSKSGRTLEGKFVEVTDGKVKVVAADGRQLAIPLDRLSREDLLWLLGPSSGKTAPVR